MMARPTQTVKICDVQDRRATVQAKLPWVVRYTIDGRHRSKSFRTRIEAERYRGLLLQAVQDRASIDETTSEPESWQTPLRDVRIHEWARRWLAEGGRSGNRELGRRRPRHGAVQHHRCRQSAKSALAMAPDQAPIRISPLPSRGPEGSNMCPLPASRKTTSSPEWPWNGAGTFATTAVFEP